MHPYYCPLQEELLQLCIGYADVYPLPLAATAVYTASALTVLRGHLHPVWPLLLVAVGQVKKGAQSLVPIGVWTFLPQGAGDGRRQIIWGFVR